MYLYADLVKDIESLSGKCFIGSAGKSVMGREIFYLKTGSGRKVLIHGGIHAREWVTTVLVMGMAKAAARSPLNAEICFVPCANPDGCDIAQTGTRDPLLIEINGSDDFSLWKANARAVDLNVNFDANWGTGVSNIKHPAFANYIGPYPGSEPETKALTVLTQRFKPGLTLSYHALGREVYWEFGQRGVLRGRDLGIAETVADALGYRRVDGDMGSAGGYKDWCIQKLGISALTIEIIDETASSHPLCEGDLAPDLSRNIDLLKLL